MPKSVLYIDSGVTLREATSLNATAECITNLGRLLLKGGIIYLNGEGDSLKQCYLGVPPIKCWRIIEIPLAEAAEALPEASHRRVDLPKDTFQIIIDDVMSI